MSRPGLRLTAGAFSSRVRQDDKAHRLLCFQLRAAGLPDFETEYLFAREAIGRDWRWDIAYVAQKLAIEVDGGIWVQGAHAHPTTIVRNMEKRNWGARLGWRLLTFSTDEAKDGRALAFIEGVLLNKPYGETNAKQEKRVSGRSGRGRRRAPGIPSA